LLETVTEPFIETVTAPFIEAEAEPESLAICEAIWNAS
jgi:hypothetical protein